MSQKSQVSLAEQYQQAVKKSQIVVFVRDNENRKLVSYTVRVEEPK
jgi:hypothetical protein